MTQQEELESKLVANDNSHYCVYETCRKYHDDCGKCRTARVIHILAEAGCGFVSGEHAVERAGVIDSDTIITVTFRPVVIPIKESE